jgi:hypothetical protein
MQCAKCGLYKEVVADIRACTGCQDGTAHQIAAEVRDDILIIEAIRSALGIGNRFTPTVGPGLSPPDLVVQENRSRETAFIEAAAKKAREEAWEKAKAEVAAREEAERARTAAADEPNTKGRTRDKEQAQDEANADAYGEEQAAKAEAEDKKAASARRGR